MKLIYLPIIAILLMTACTSNNNPVSKAPLIPLKDFFKNPEKIKFKISPNGEYLAFMQPLNSRLNVYVQKIGDKEIKAVTNSTERDIAGYFWKGENKIIFTKDNNGDENFHLFSVNNDGTNLLDLTPYPKVRVDVIDDLPESPNFILIQMNKRNPNLFDVYRLDVSNGKTEIIAENPGNVMGWLTDHEGKLRIAITSDGVNNSILYRENETDSFKVILETTFRESFNPLFFTFDNKNLYVSSNLGRDKSAIIEFDLSTNKENKVIYQNDDFDVDELLYSRKNKKLLGVGFVSWKQELLFIDQDRKTLQSELESKLAGYDVFITDLNKAEDKLIVKTLSDKTRGAYYFYDIKTKELLKLSDVSPWLDEKEMCEMKPIKYKTRDGLVIPGYLTLPKGVKPENLPVVINPHGGPWARDVWGFNPEVQFFANRGYAVLQMNFRGSTGYGRQFWESSFKQWGRTMQNDITDGVNWLIDEGIADKERIAIYGGSYGGYAVLAGLTLTPDLYAAGIDYVGVANLFTFMESIPPYWKPYIDMLYEMVGNPVSDSIKLWETSPVFHVDKIKAPLLVVQGAQDPRVNKNESDQMVEALLKRGIDVPYLVKDNEGHGFRNEENRMEFYETAEKFLEKHVLNKSSKK